MSSQGDCIAWTKRTFGRTSGISAIHRVYQDGRTYCLLQIPEESRHLDLTLVALPICELCDKLFHGQRIMGWRS